MEENKLYVGTHFNIERKILTIGAIETEINKAIKNYNGKKILLMVSKEINSLCEINLNYDAEGFGVFKIQVDNKLSAKEFVLTELENKPTQFGSSGK
jgi:hypothetical protein